MRRFIFILLLAGLGWFGYSKYQRDVGMQRETSAQPQALQSRPAAGAKAPAPNAASFKCDGRTHCSQMTSCEEANFFLKNCPGTKMDGNHDGIPCEKQWCKVAAR